MTPGSYIIPTCQIINLRQVLPDHSWISGGAQAWSRGGNPGRIRAVEVVVVTL